MATVDLEGVYKVTAKGKTYYYAWRGKGAPRLKGEPGSPEFIASLQEAQQGRKRGDKAKMSGLCAMFRASDAWNGRGPKPISEKTRATWKTWLDRIQVEFGELSIAQFDRPQMRPRITKWRDRYYATPRAADTGVEVMSRLLSFGRAEGLLLHNICNGIERIYSADRAAIIWTEDDLAKLEAAASPEVYQAAKLAELTGLRQSDLLKLSWRHIGPLSIEITAGKSRRNGKPGRKTLIPLYGELKDYLATLPKRALTVLVNTDGEPWKTGFGSSWGTALERAGIKKHFHDLRGNAATRYYRADYSIREIAQIMVWTEDAVEDLIDRYVKKDELLLDRIRRMDEHAERTKSAKPPAKPSGEN